MIQTSAGDMLFGVKEIHVFISIWGEINIGLTLEDVPWFNAVKTFGILNMQYVM